VAMCRPFLTKKEKNMIYKVSVDRSYVGNNDLFLLFEKETELNESDVVEFLEIEWQYGYSDIQEFRITIEEADIVLIV
jgi:hypothetical protein